MNKLYQNKISIFVKTNHQDFLQKKKKKTSKQESNNLHAIWTHVQKLHLNEINKKKVNELNQNKISIFLSLQPSFSCFFFFSFLWWKQLTHGSWLTPFFFSFSFFLSLRDSLFLSLPCCFTLCLLVK